MTKFAEFLFHALRWIRARRRAGHSPRPLRYIVSRTPLAQRRLLSASATIRQAQVAVRWHVPEVDDTVGGKSSRARRKLHPYVHRRFCPQPEVRLVRHPGRVAVGCSDLPLADEGFGVTQAAGLVDANLGPDAAPVRVRATARASVPIPSRCAATVGRPRW